MAELKGAAVLFGEVESLAAARSGATFVDGWSGIKFGTKEMPSFYYENYHGLGNYSNMGPSAGYDAAHNAPWMDAHRAAYRNAMEETGGSMLVPYEGATTSRAMWQQASGWGKLALGAKAVFAMATSAPMPGAQMNWVVAQRQIQSGNVFGGVETISGPSPTLADVQRAVQTRRPANSGKRGQPHPKVVEDLHARHSVAHHTFNSIDHVHHTYTTMGRPLLPGKKTVTHRWSSGNSNVSISTGDTGVEVIKVNTPIDIGGSLSSGDGHEPMGYTQYAAMYEQCYVKECRVILDYFNAEESGQTPASGAYSGVVMGLCPKDDTSELPTIGHYEELDGCTWRVVPPEGTGRMTYAIKPNRFFGISDKTAHADDTLRIVGVTQPTNLCYLHAFVQRMNITNTDVINVRLHWTVEMDIVWMEPKALAQS